MHVGGAIACKGLTFSRTLHPRALASGVIHLSSGRSCTYGAVIGRRNDERTNMRPGGGSDIRPPALFTQTLWMLPQALAAGCSLRTVAFLGGGVVAPFDSLIRFGLKCFKSSLFYKNKISSR